MRKSTPIFYSALLLTGVNLLLRLAGTSFQVYLSSRIGPAGIGLLQLTLSVGGLAMVAGTAGIRTGTMYLTAEELGKSRPENVTWVLSACFGYSILFSTAAAVVLYLLSPWIAHVWIGSCAIVNALRLCAAFLPVCCLCGVMTGYFTAAQRIGTLSVTEMAEQAFTIAVTLLLLHFHGKNDPGKACLCVVLGSGLGSCLTLITLVTLRLLEHPRVGNPIPMAGRFRKTVLPLAAADNLRTGISTVENLMVPRQLSKYSRVTDPMAEFGTVSGMVFPVLMFPACILFALAELLIPELARCKAAGSRERISYLVGRGLRVAMLYGTLFGGWLFLSAQMLCERLYSSTDAGIWLRTYSLLAPVLYCDIITDAMTKGLGQQRICVRYNIITNLLDIALLFLLLPKFGMAGYFVSFVITHVLNFALSLRRLVLISGRKIRPHIPILTAVGTGAAVWITEHLSLMGMRNALYPVVGLCLLYLLQVIRREDVLWLKGLIKAKK